MSKNPTSVDSPTPAFRQLQAFTSEQTARKPRSTPKPNATRLRTAPVNDLDVEDDLLPFGPAPCDTDH